MKSVSYLKYTALAFATAFVTFAQANELTVFVDVSDQKMYVLNETEIVSEYYISTGKRNSTPLGNYTVTRKHRYYRSKKYDSQMNYAQFFNGGIAFHETKSKIDGVARSHGCVRMSSVDAKNFWEISQNKKIKVEIVR